MMMKSCRTIFLSIFAAIISLPGLYAQEVQFNLARNPQLTAKLSQHRSVNNLKLTLPFFDDFTSESAFPESTQWIDSDVFVNRDMAIDPPNYGVATFDILDDRGSVYTYASTQPFKADYLTSAIIRLDSVFVPNGRKLDASDSVFFSFAYQIQGRGDIPETNDSLVLQFGVPTGNLVFEIIDSIFVPVDLYLLANQIDTIFPNDTLHAPEGCNPLMFRIADRILTWGDDILMPCDSLFMPEIRWQTVWAVPGVSISDTLFPSSELFYSVNIPITEDIYFNKDFRFRFFNYGSIASTINPGNRGNVDQWSIDMVYLALNRRMSDLSYPKVSFSNRAASFLKRYESMPYKQYRSDPTNTVRPEFEMQITNQDKVTHATHYWYKVLKKNGSQVYGYDGGNCELLPFDLGGFMSCSSSCGAFQACPPVNGLFPLDLSVDTASFEIIHYISDSTEPYTLVDSMRYHQGFYNYFAYDDGTPELGYGIEPLGAMVAVQFKMTTPDTLKGVQLFFNQTLNEANYKYFDIVVWADNNNRPGTEVYRKAQQHPRWSNDRNGFVYYSFETPLLVSGLFYIGLVQAEAGSLNIGYDMSRNSREYTFYKVDEPWVNSQFSGSLMIRPVVGTNDFIGLSESSDQKSQFTLSPNPASDKITIDITDPTKIVSLWLSDLFGRLLFRIPYQPTLDVNSLLPGLYFVGVQSENGSTVVAKLLISR